MPKSKIVPKSNKATQTRLDRKRVHETRAKKVRSESRPPLKTAAKPTIPLETIDAIRVYLPLDQREWINKRMEISGVERSRVVQDIIAREMRREKEMGGATELECLMRFIQRGSAPGFEELAEVLEAFFGNLYGTAKESA